MHEKRQKAKEDENHTGQTWVNQQWPTPQDSAQYELPLTVPLPHELNGRGT